MPVKKIIKWNLFRLCAPKNEERPRWIKSIRGPEKEERERGVDVVITFIANPMGTEPDVLKPFKLRLAFALDESDAMVKHRYFMLLRKQLKPTSKKNIGPWAWPIVLSQGDKGKNLLFHLEKIMEEVEVDRNVILLR